MSYYEQLPIFKSTMDTIVLPVERPCANGAMKHRELRYLVEPVVPAPSDPQTHHGESE